MKAAVYIRVSTDEQALRGHSMEAQQDIIEDFIKRNNHELHEIYIDDGYSAKNMKRPALIRLLADAKLNKYDMIIIWRLDRITRTAKDGLIMIYDMFENVGIKFVSISEDIDTTTSDGRMMLTIRLSMAQAERERIGERTTIGFIKRAQKGGRNSPSKPYGYDVGKDLKLTVNEEEKPIVQMIFTWYIKGWGITKIARELNKSGLPSPRGGTWSHIGLKAILTSPTHIGYNHWKPKGAVETILVKGDHEPIILEETYYLVQEMAARKYNGEMTKSSHDYYFSSILKCAQCGNPFYGKLWVRGNNKQKRYKCSGRAVKGICIAPEVSEARIAQLVLDEITMRIESDTTKKLITSVRENNGRERKRLELQLQKSKDVQKNLVKLLSSAKIDQEVYDEMREEEKNTMNIIQNQINDLSDDAPQKEATRAEALKRFKFIKDSWEEMTEEDRKMFCQHAFKQVRILKENGEWRIVGLETAF